MFPRETLMNLEEIRTVGAGTFQKVCSASREPTRELGFSTRRSREQLGRKLPL